MTGMILTLYEMMDHVRRLRKSSVIGAKNVWFYRALDYSRVHNHDITCFVVSNVIVVRFVFAVGHADRLIPRTTA